MTTRRAHVLLAALRAGETVEIEGVSFRAAPGPLSPGDTYAAGRNSGPHILTVARVVVEDNLVGGYVCPVENAYPFDLPECVKVALAE